MKKRNYYWSIYKNLEKETLKLAEVIFFADEQRFVYSSYIADLIVRCAIEIEAISKEIFLLVASDDEKSIKDEDMFFDTVCLDKINEIWNIGKKAISISSTKMYFESGFSEFCPLVNVNKRGKGKWKKGLSSIKA